MDDLSGFILTTDKKHWILAVFFSPHCGLLRLLKKSPKKCPGLKPGQGVN
jgi:hypothetical protein